MRQRRLTRFAPGVAALGDYQRSWFRPDLLAILVGIVLVIGGIFRLGRIADFLSRVRTEIRDELYKGAIKPRIGTDRI
ncbi:MAG: hypothetical protein V3U50_00215, partial [Acidimicrobiia bacterium]